MPPPRPCMLVVESESQVPVHWHYGGPPLLAGACEHTVCSPQDVRWQGRGGKGEEAVPGQGLPCGSFLVVWYPVGSWWRGLRQGEGLVPGSRVSCWHQEGRAAELSLESSVQSDGAKLGSGPPGARLGCCWLCMCACVSVHVSV